MEPNRRVTFDDRLWPIHVALIGLGGLAVGVVVNAGGWDDPRPLFNGWIRLMTLGATFAGLGWGMTTLSPRRARRLHLAVLISLIAHMVLAVALQQHYLQQFVEEERPVEPKVVETPPVRVPVHVPPDEKEAEFEKPIETKPVEVVQNAPLERQEETEPNDAPWQPAEPPDTEDPIPPAKVADREIERERPRRAEDLAKMQRRPSTETSAAGGATAPSRKTVAKRELASLEAAALDALKHQKAMSLRVEAEADLPETPTTSDRQDRTPRVREDRRDARPTIAQLPDPARPQRPIEIAPSADVAATSEQPSRQSAELERLALTVQATGIERASAQSPPRREEGVIALSSSSLPQDNDSESIAPSRARQSEVPSITPHSRDDDAPRRTFEVAERPVSPAEAPSTLAAQNSSTSRAGPAPNALALSRGSQGFVGGESSPNAGRDLPTGEEHLAPSASVAARRATATQQETGPALSPTMDARLAKATAGADAPSAPARAQPLETPEVAGSQQPGQLAASSSAAVDRQFANAPLGRITASVGSGELDTGVEQIVPSVGTGRASGGGQPQIQVAAVVPTRRAAMGGGAPAAAIDAKFPAHAPAAPQTTGGGAPVAADRLAASTTRGEGRTSAASIVATPRSGGAPQSAAIGLPSSVDVRRATTGRAEPGLASGGGTSAPRTRQGAATPALSRAEIPIPATMPRAVGTSSGPSLTPSVDDQRESMAGMSPWRAALGPAAGELESAADGFESGGLGATSSTIAGVPDRFARSESDVVHSTPDRFVKKRTTGLPTIRGAARRPAPAFAQRAKRGDPSDAASPQLPTEKTEAAIELGLAFLSRWQLTDGRWSLDRNGVDLARSPRERPQLKSDAAATGLALLAFLGAGYDHFEDKYRDHVEAGLGFLVQNQKPSGDLYIPGDAESSTYAHFYSHGIATIALCEAFGMTGDPALREPAQAAINFIVASQNKEQGGWRYYPQRESDLSVTGWQIMALKSGELAGLTVPKETYERAATFLEKCQRVGGGRFVYHPNAPKSNWRKPSTVMTSVGLLTSLYMGKNRDDPTIQRGADHLLANLAEYGPKGYSAKIGTIGNPGRDTYYWYYATQVMFHMRGGHWKAWNEHLHPLLVSTQTKTGALAGSWNPFWKARDRWATHGGRLYVTTMNLLSLEVYYRHLPLYEATAK